MLLSKDRQIFKAAFTERGKQQQKGYHSCQGMNTCNFGISTASFNVLSLKHTNLNNDIFLIVCRSLTFNNTKK